jgi:hypothetical protein
MYLVLEEEDDQEGFCLKECRGKLIYMNVCISNEKKNNSPHNDKIEVKQQWEKQAREGQEQANQEKQEAKEEIGGER